MRMKRIAALLLLTGLSVAWVMPARGQQMSVAEYNRKNAKAGKRQQKLNEKAAKNQAKAQKKAAKAQKKSIEKQRKADDKANRALHH